MRATTASGTVPSTIIGRTRWLAAERAGAGVVGVPAVDQHEAGDRLDEHRVADPARHRRPAECHREQQDRHQPPPEDRHRGAGDRDAHQPVVEHRAAPHRRHHAERHADQHGEQDGADRQFDRGREQLQELAPDRVLRHDRGAEIAARHLLLRSAGTAATSAGRSRSGGAVRPAARARCRARRTASRSDRRAPDGSAGS